MIIVDRSSPDLSYCPVMKRKRAPRFCRGPDATHPGHVTTRNPSRPHHHDRSPDRPEAFGRRELGEPRWHHHIRPTTPRRIPWEVCRPTIIEPRRLCDLGTPSSLAFGSVGRGYDPADGPVGIRQDPADGPIGIRHDRANEPRGITTLGRARRGSFVTVIDHGSRDSGHP